MKNNGLRPEFLKISKINLKNTSADISKKPNINILLNRVKTNKQTELKKKIIFSSLLILLVSSMAFFFLSK